MKVFFSWSGPLSKQIAETFREWLPTSLQFIDPYFTPEDIDKGTRWSGHIAQELEGCEIGLIFLTSENLEAPWIMFEAGALSKKLASSQVCPLLFGLGNSDVSGPLTQFQSTLFNKDETLRLFGTLNQNAGERALPPKRLELAFETFWNAVEPKVQQILSQKVRPKKAKRTSEDMLEEILDLVRANSRQANLQASRLLRPGPGVTLSPVQFTTVEYEPVCQQLAENLYKVDFYPIGIAEYLSEAERRRLLICSVRVKAHNSQYSVELVTVVDKQPFIGTPQDQVQYFEMEALKIVKEWAGPVGE